MLSKAPLLQATWRPVQPVAPCTNYALPPRRAAGALPRAPRLVATRSAGAVPLDTAAFPRTPPSSSNPISKWLSWWILESPTPDATEEAEGPKRTKLLPLVKRIISLVVPDKKLLAGATVFMILAAAAELAVPHFATSCIFAAAAAGATTASFEGTLKLLAGIIIFYGVMSALRGYCFSVLNNRMTMRLRTRLFGNLVRRETSFFDANDTGSLTSRLQADCQAMTKCVATNLNIAFRNMMQAIGGVAYLAYTSPVMCAATLGVCVILWSLTLLYGEYARRTQKVYQDTLACGNQVAEEVLTLTRVVRTFGTEGFEEQRYSGWLGRLYNVGLRQATGYGLFVASGHIACYMTKVVALVIGCTLVLKGALTAEQLTNFIFYVEFVTYASLSACDEIVEVMEAVGASERVLNLLEAPPAPQVAEGTTPAGFSGRVEFKDVCFSYPTRPHQAALTDVNLVLQPGQLVALVGLSGSGKTTLVALLQRLYDPISGAILIDGQDLRTVDASWYRSQIGVVSQEPRLFGTSVSANIAYGCPNATQQDIEAAACAAHAHDFIMALPQGYQSKVTDRLLSGGQKQRIALARALVRNPRLLVLDEATSALDAESEAQVQAALDEAMRERNRTVIVIAHRLSTVLNADVTVVMDRGKIVERGSHQQLMQVRGIYHNLVARQHYMAEDNSKQQQSAAGAQQNGNGASYNGNGNGVYTPAPSRPSGGTRVAVLDSADDLSFKGTTSSDESSGARMVPHLVGAGVVAAGAVDDVDVELMTIAAAAVTAENELVSKVLGSQDPIDHASGN